jgi:hypothetical protein
MLEHGVDHTGPVKARDHEVGGDGQPLDMEGADHDTGDGRAR